MSIFRTYQIHGRPVLEDEYGRYVSEHLNEWLAEAWEIGLDAGLREPNPGESLELPPNPYRVPSASEGDRT